MKLLKSFKYAWNGFVVAFKEQPNLRIHFLMASIVTALAIYFHVTPTEWLILLLAMSLVLSLEFINSAIENLTDLVTKEQNPLAGKVKDMAAAAVMIAALLAIGIGVIIFWKYIF
ncbi:MAG TPA: diacylglycerol kinase [Cytophagales bacterium]|jgi:diacylglycerol kinase|nr:diacylglycerol kinase [Cytophagales bacterium]